MTAAESAPGRFSSDRRRARKPADLDDHVRRDPKHPTDDPINVAGHRLGTREIEESIASRPKLAEVAVVGVHDQIKGQVAVAFAIGKDTA